MFLPPTSREEYTQDFHAIAASAIWNDVRSSGNDEFTGTHNPAWAPYGGKLF